MTAYEHDEKPAEDLDCEPLAGGTCEDCETPLVLRFDLMNDEHTPACPNRDCSLYYLTQLGTDDDERSFGPNQRRAR